LVAHVSVPHTVFTAYLEHPPAPSQRPFVPQVVAPWSIQTPRRSAALAGRGVHVPRVAESEQLRHAPPQVSLQHTPSTQKPDPQSEAFVQTPPSCMGPQLWLTHAIPVVQSASVVQLGLQAADTQR
jgi:hypothetical protein